MSFVISFALFVLSLLFGGFAVSELWKSKKIDRTIVPYIFFGITSILLATVSIPSLYSLI